MGNLPSVADIHISRIGEPPQVDQGLEPVFQVSGEGAGELRVGQQAVHGHAVASVDVLVEFPRGAEERIDGRCWAFIPADGELAAFVLEPVERFLGLAGLFLLANLWFGRLA